MSPYVFRAMVQRQDEWLYQTDCSVRCNFWERPCNAPCCRTRLLTQYKWLAQSNVGAAGCDRWDRLIYRFGVLVVPQNDEERLSRLASEFN